MWAELLPLFGKARMAHHFPTCSPMPPITSYTRACPRRTRNWEYTSQHHGDGINQSPDVCFDAMLFIRHNVYDRWGCGLTESLLQLVA